MESDFYLTVAVICSISTLWYSLMAAFFPKRVVLKIYGRHRRAIQRASGAVFILFGLKLTVLRLGAL